MKCVLFSLILMMIALTGCGGWSLIDKSDFIAVNENVALLSASFDEGKVLMKEAVRLELLDAEKTNNIITDIEKYQPVLAEATKAIAEAPTLIEGVMEANKISAPVNPYAGTFDLVLKLIAGTGVLGSVGFAARNRQNANAKTKIAVEKEKVEVKYKATNSANELLRMNHPEIAKEHYELVGTSKMAELANKGIS